MKALLFLATALLATACSYERSGEITTVTFNGPADHTAFPITGFPHEGLDCDGCHGPFDSFTYFTCIDCHTHDRAVVDPPHAAISGYEYDSFACLGCHPDGLAAGASGVDHARLFPIDVGDRHASVACSECHVDPGDRTVLACAGCHPHTGPTTDGQHPAVGGYAFESTLCLRCHFDSQVSRVAAHRPFLIQPGKPHAAPVACLACHDSTRPDRAWAADFTRRRCTPCHAETPTRARHGRVAAFTYGDAACQGCHPSGEGGMDPTTHAPFYPIAPGTTHAVAACSDCHLDPQNPRAAFGCNSCHLGSHDRGPMDGVHGGVGSLYAFDSAACVACHPRSRVVRRSNHSNRRFDNNNVSQGPHKSKRCSKCHTSRAFDTFNCSPCHDPGGNARGKTRGCDNNKGSPCTDQEKYLYYYK